MTEEALTTETAFLPSASSSSSMAALVMEEVMMTPGAISILTTPLTAPFSMETTVPGS